MRLILVSTLLFITFSCTPGNKPSNWHEKIEFEKKKVLNLHDTLMLELKHVSNLLKSLKVAVNDSTLDRKTINSYELTISELANADKKMWDWMHNFNLAYKHTQDSITLIYFKNQYKEIDSVRALFDSSILAGEELISRE
ncbi:MAG: hypothetical protein L3J29_00485 [Cyclobacteriaceae bacterium]|nr:hypothetical protein [Cyclobacteriaceae bacterium]